MSTYLTIAEVAELLGVTENSARSQLSRWGIKGAVMYPAPAVHAAHRARPGRGNWVHDPYADRYTLHANGDLHRYRCSGCDWESGSYRSKSAATRAARRHADSCTATPA